AANSISAAMLTWPPFVLHKIHRRNCFFQTTDTNSKHFKKRFFRVYCEGIFTTETRSSQRSEYFLIKNSLLCALGASAVQSPSPSSPRTGIGRGYPCGNLKTLNKIGFECHTPTSSRSQYLVEKSRRFSAVKS